MIPNMKNFEDLKAQQLLPPEAYTSQEWFEREKDELFGKTWSFACLEKDIPEVGDYITVQVGNYPLVVLRDRELNVRVFHNICRHRGAKILEGTGNCKTGLKCRYHYWMFNLDGSVRGIPQKDVLFSDCDKANLGLKQASMGVFKGMVFVNPQAEPDQSFDQWLDGIKDDAWEEIGDEVVVALEINYEVQANWKLVFENANDGYHLSYLHEHTLGGPLTNHQKTVSYGLHSCYQGSNQYYAEILKKGNTTLAQTLYAAMDKKALKEATADVAPEDYEEFTGGHDLYFMFPNVVVSSGALGFMYFQIIPVAPNKTISKFRFFTPPGYEKDYYKANNILMPNPGVKTRVGVNEKPIKLSEVEGGFDSKNFQVEDMWICEQMQQGLKSPAYEAGPYAPGTGEGPITFFQANVLSFMDKEKLNEVI
ncbi:aromatic ring-hydroxylating dioxygenase subunit alpha [Maricurvus nonylphenolicus]|uniref:aromatic ring-hydroxylating oxygenase subunit alpha n=1 Tax=Maricurvus nonylphenolicus TaxID=1008307 RepID=UPI0036F3BD7C